MTTNTVASGKSLTLKSGGPEILVSNLGQGNTTVVVTIGKKNLLPKCFKVRVLYRVFKTLCTR